MAVGQEKVEALIEAVYEAGLVPERWEAFLAEAGRAVGAASASALWFDGAGTILLRADAWRTNPDAVAAYAAHYIALCPRLRLSRRYRPGEVYDDLAVRAAPSPSDREYYAYMDPLGYGQARTVLAERNADLRMGLNFYGSIRESEREEEHRLLTTLAPHVRRASHLTLRVMDTAERAVFGDALFEMSPAMILLGSGGAVRRLNGRAEAVLAGSDGLRLLAGHLRATSPADDARLQAEIGAALSPKAAGGPPSDGLALVSRLSGRPAWAVSAVPLPPHLGENLGVASPRALVTIAETVPRISPKRLRRVFGLSQAEAEVAAALAGGLHPDEIAAARHASLETVRAQLKSVFSKLEVSTQAQLVGRVASLGVLPAPPPPN